jgi:ABC-2 type transport system ATP-binding protein
MNPKERLEDQAPPQDPDLLPVLACRELAKRFGAVQAVRDVSFTIAPGETYGLLGPNGAGKTTTISIVCGLLDPDTGDVLLEGASLTTHRVGTKAAIGYVPQELAIYPDLSARENLHFFGRLYGMAGRELARRTDEVLELIGLTERAGDRTSEYSGGMKRRLNIGLGLLHRPRLLVLDEPTVASIRRVAMPPRGRSRGGCRAGPLPRRV